MGKLSRKYNDNLHLIDDLLNLFRIKIDPVELLFDHIYDISKIYENINQSD